MKNIKAIVAMDRNGLIGNNNMLPWKCKEDMRHFKKLTSGNAVIMGRKTFESLNMPNGLPNRLNIVLSNTTKSDTNIIWCNSIESVLNLEIDSAYVIGGAMIYKSFMPHISELHISKIPGEYTGDTWFPAIPPRIKLYEYIKMETFTYEIWK